MYVIFGLCLLPTVLSRPDGRPLYLTPLIEQGSIEEAQLLANVTLQSLPDVGTSYAGLFTVHKQYNSNIFFWYFVAQQNKETAPIIVWLNGGPGVSSIMGLIEENGPFYVDGNLQPHKREYSWHKDHHLIYLDNPVGVGYSFTEDERGYSNTTKDCTDNLYSALVQFFKMFPYLQQNDLYIFGESYGGKYAPALAWTIHKNGAIENLKGIGVGNGITDPVNINMQTPDYLYQQGFLDENGRHEMTLKTIECAGDIQDYIDGKTIKSDSEILDECFNLGNPFITNTIYHNLTGYAYLYNVLHSYDINKQNTDNREAFMNLNSTRDAIHVDDLPRFRNVTQIVKRLGITILLPETKSVEYLLNHKVRVLVYTGQLDVCVPYIGTVNYIKQLDFPGKELYRTVARNIWYVDEAVAGYWKQAEGLTEVMVVGAGHMVPIDQPKRAYDLIYKFTHNQNIC